MKRFQNILVVVAGKDGGDAAVEQAGILAQHCSARLTLVDAIEPLPAILDIEGTEPVLRHKQYSQQKLMRLEQHADRLRQQGVSVSSQLLDGDPAEKTIERVISRQHDLVIKSADHPEGLAQRFFGTLGQRLFRKCPCPVWITKAEPAARIGRILLAVDPLPLHKERNPMNIAIVQIATSLAQLHDSELHVVYAWPKWTQWPTVSSEHQNNSAERKAQSDCDALQERTLEKLVGPFRDDGHVFTSHLLRGNAGDAVVGLADALEVDLLVMGAVSRNNFVLFSIGGTAEHILDHVNCSVLAIKPVEFLPGVFPQAVQRGLGFSFG